MSVQLQKPSPPVEQFFEQDVAKLLAELQTIEQQNPADQPANSDVVLQQLTDAIDDCLTACEALDAEYLNDTEEQADVRARFREAIKPWFMQSWFMHRGTTKPRGFAGDYQILNAIYENVPRSGGIGGYLDRYFLRSSLASAVRSRLDCVQKFLIEETALRTSPLSVIDVASGPGREFTSIFHRGQPTIALTCIDIDQEALDHLYERIARDAADSIDVVCHKYNALRMSSARATVEKFGEADMIYSVGLCDYIPDRQMIAILQGWREAVNPQGVIYVSYKDVTQHRPAQNQWLVDWHFIPRVEEDCRRLFAEAGYWVDQIEMFRDDTSVIMNFVARGPALNRLHSSAMSSQDSITISQD
ncbi:MAG: class I SAM-dependent methyltransferase [Planctomycetaceae bacterium]